MADDERLADLLNRQAPADRPLVECLIKAARPRKPWQIRKERLDARDDAIIALAGRHYADQSVNAAAKLIANDLTRFASVKIDAVAPLDLDIIRENLLHVCALCVGEIPGAGQIRRILSGTRTPQG
ncbi:hypothetical protein [Beijerinckia mobilis]|uniref:hypothetical protein n=1 Tax=Beijerinckia mobilis TaxID=231434 RepID=UPI000557B92F|nr:hypothetical protein [Beijerinckia mobilis]